MGYRQIFVRFHGCPLACRYCDTPASHEAAPARCLVERVAGQRRLGHLPNPLHVDDLLAAVCRVQRDFPHHSVSLTGGEPLTYRAFLDHLLPRLHAAGLRSFLETNGVLAEQMDALALLPNYVAMDMKLPSCAGVPPLWDAHAAFLDVVLRRVRAEADGLSMPERLQVKLVFGEDSLADITRAVDVIAACRADIPCILQPVTARSDGPKSPSAELVLEAQRVAACRLTDVRVIPQTHVLLGQW